MDFINIVKSWVGALTELGLMLIALAITASLLYGGNIPFFGNTAANITAFVKALGDGGLVGLIALGFILWLFSHRRMS
jgi:predicted small integral membrane protein